MMAFILLVQALIGCALVSLAPRHSIAEFLAAVATVAPLVGLIIVGVYR